MVRHTTSFKNQPQKEIAKILRQISTRHDLWKVFRDFAAMTAIAYSNAVDLRQFDEREAEYMRVIKPYSKEELNQFAECMAYVVEGIDTESDFLGELFMSLEISSSDKGQFFTPFSISYLMAQVTLKDEFRDKIEKNGFITFSDPCIGGGAMAIAAAKVLADSKCNYQTQLHVTGIDIDIVAVHMAYIQMSLLHIPAVIYHGNTLTNQMNSDWYTPAHILNGWNYKLRQQNKINSANEPKQSEPTQEVFNGIMLEELEQPSLF